MCSCRPLAAMANSSRRTASGIVGRVDLAPQARPCRTAARRRGRRRRPGRSEAPSSSVSANGAMMPSRLTKRLATLVAMISLRSRWREDRVAVPLLHRRREGGEQLALQRRIVGRARRPRSPPAAHLGGRQQRPPARAGSGRRFCWARRSSSSLRRPAPRRRGRAGRSPRESRSTGRSCGSARAPPRSAIDKRQRLQPVVLEHELGDLVGHLGEQQVALLELEPALDHLAVERDLDVDLIVRAIDAGADCR